MLPKNKVDELRALIDLFKQCPHILHLPELDFFRSYIVDDLRGTLPPVAKKEEEKSSSPVEDIEEDPQPETEEEEMESDVELDMEGVIEDNDDTEHEMGDPSKSAELSDSDMEAFDAKRSEAMSALGSGEWSSAIDLFTESIKINPHSAAMFAKRGTCYLKMKKPKACIRDCNRAIELNPDNASAYKFRGRSYRLLGKFLEAAKDLRTACKIDFDEQADEWLKEVTPNAKKLEEHARRMERRKEEQELMEKKERIKKAQEARAKAAEEAASKGESEGGMPGVDPSLLEALSDPEVSKALEDVLQNPANISKYQSNPKVMKIFTKMASQMGGAGGFPGMFPGMGGMPGGMPGMGGMPGGMPGMGGMPGGMPGMGGMGSSAPPNNNPGPPPTKPAASTDDLD